VTISPQEAKRIRALASVAREQMDKGRDRPCWVADLPEWDQAVTMVAHEPPATRWQRATEIYLVELGGHTR